MMKGLNAYQLKAECERMIDQGHGEKEILIVDDDEGNGYHTLFYGFQNPAENAEVLEYSYAHDRQSPDTVILLG